MNHVPPPKNRITKDTIDIDFHMYSSLSLVKGVHFGD